MSKSLQESYDKVEFEEAKALKTRYGQTMIKIIMLQAITNVISTICNEVINFTKYTVLVAAIGIGDLLRAAKEIVTREFTITPFIAAIHVFMFRSVEKKYSIYKF